MVTVVGVKSAGLEDRLTHRTVYIMNEHGLDYTVIAADGPGVHLCVHR